jgi:large subunit ribosomal protein L29
MKMDEIRQLSLEELKKRLQDEEENLSNLRFQLATQQLASPIRVRTVRRDIARIKTLIRQRAAEAPAPAAQSQSTEAKA